MIVDDAPMNRYSLMEMLNLICGKKCIEASNGEECVNIIKRLYKEKKCRCKRSLEMIFMDIDMPVMDGY